MRTVIRLAAVAGLFSVGCADLSDPLAPLPPSFSIAGDLVVNALDDVTDPDGCTVTHCSLCARRSNRRWTGRRSSA